MPPWGRPPGALAGDFGGNGRRLEEWGPRSRQFRELDNSDEDDGQGVYLDPAGYMSRSQERFAGDELQFTGYDLNWARDGQRSANASLEDVGYGETYRYQDENGRSYYEEQRQAYYRRHGDLVTSANEKLRKAKEKGKTSVNLSPEEVEALQRSQTPQQREDTPPKTPSKNRSSRSSSGASQTGKKSSKKPSSSRLFSSSSPSASRSRTPKSSRKSSGSEQQSNAPPPPPAFMIKGPDGVPIYAPVGYYPPSPEIRPGSDRSRAASPPVDPAYPPYPTRYYNSPAELRPGSSSRSPYDDSLRIPRNRSASNAQHASEFFGAPPVPAAQARRNVSGPPDSSYSKVPRVQARSPLATREPSNSPAQPWPVRTDSRPGVTPAATSSSSSSDDGEEGVRVEILPEAYGNGYTIDRRPVGGGSSSEVKRRKGRK